MRTLLWMEFEKQLEVLGFQKGTVVSKGWYHEDGYHLFVLRNSYIVIRNNGYCSIPKLKGASQCVPLFAIKGLLGVSLSLCSPVEEIQDLLYGEFGISLSELG